MTLRGGPSLAISWRPPGLRSYGLRARGKFGTCGPSPSARCVLVRRLSGSDGSTTRATRLVPAPAA
eukprot:4881802-Alexandrium_andersonii.AAC.1